MTWRPISEAPRDGTEFLGWARGTTVMIWWMGIGGEWGCDIYSGGIYAPTHWQPLPPPPPEVET